MKYKIFITSVISHASLNANLHFLNKLWKWEISPSDFHLVALISAFPLTKWAPLCLENTYSIPAPLWFFSPFFSSLLFFPQSLSFFPYFLLNILRGRLQDSTDGIPLSHANSIPSCSDSMTSDVLDFQVLDAFLEWFMSMYGMLFALLLKFQFLESG